MNNDTNAPSALPADAALDATLQAADTELLNHIHTHTDPTAGLLRIMATTEAEQEIPRLAGSPDGGPFDSDDDILLPTLRTIGQRMDSTLAQATVTATTVSAWEQRTLHHASQYMTAAPRHLLLAVLTDFAEIQHHCGHVQPIELQRRLRRIAAKLAGLIGMLLINLGHHQQAGEFFHTAQTAADDTGESGLRAWVTVRRALVAHYYSDPMEGLLLARQATDLADNQPCAARAMAPVTEARALARLAQLGRTDAADAAQRALARGEQVFPETNTSEQNDPVFGYTRRQMLFHLGEALAELGLYSEAETYLTQALELYAPNEQLDRTLIQFDRAYCRASTGNTTEAARLAAHTTQQLPPEYRTTILRQRARHLETIIRAHDGNTPAIQAFQDVIAML
ncbi:hypothetical protein ACIBEJ_33920 [Nonomuraea sp. NPDC050790]|uniref:hypothetical protein n=1 Tax=Nonomuraea sp. NPDC050790 TaxID=3364371 RepID=UPI0037B21883